MRPTTIWNTIVSIEVVIVLNNLHQQQHHHSLYWFPACWGRCVSSDEDCLPPRVPTGADVSFLSTLGCSLRVALTSGSMTLVLLSPFICSERTLAPVLVCRWPSFHLAPSLSLSPPLTAGSLNQQQTDGKSLGSSHACTPCTNTQTSLRQEPLMHLNADTNAAHPRFFFIFYFAPRAFPHNSLSFPFYRSICLSLQHSLSEVFFILLLWSSKFSRSTRLRVTSCGTKQP